MKVILVSCKQPLNPLANLSCTAIVASHSDISFCMILLQYPITDVMQDTSMAV